MIYVRDNWKSIYTIFRNIAWLPRTVTYWIVEKVLWLGRAILTRDKRLVRFMTVSFPLFVVEITLTVFAWNLLLNLDSLLPVANNALISLAAASALCFTYAQILGESETREKIVFAGERFMFSALYLIIAAILKYVIPGASQGENRWLTTFLLFPRLVVATLTLISMNLLYVGIKTLLLTFNNDFTSEPEAD